MLHQYCYDNYVNFCNCLSGFNIVQVAHDNQVQAKKYVIKDLNFLNY